VRVAHKITFDKATHGYFFKFSLQMVNSKSYENGKAR